LSFIYSCKTSNKKSYGTYKISAGAFITLKEDSTFSFRRVRHMSGVTASGKYELKSDTILFSYSDCIYDSIINPALGQRNWTLSQLLGLHKKLL
jgi:hypothetical protein